MKSTIDTMKSSQNINQESKPYKTPRSSFIFLGILVMILLLSVGFVVASFKTASLSSITTPLKHLYLDLENAAQESSSEPTVSNDVRNIINKSSTSEAVIEITSVVTIVPTQIPTLPAIKVTEFIRPTEYIYPSIPPGEVGSKEWLEQFWKNYEETKQRTKDAVERQKQFCNNPSLCN